MLIIFCRLEVVKNGVLIETIDLNEFAWYMIGRQMPENSEESKNFLLMEHPTLSR